MTDILKVIQHLKQQRARIVFDNEEDEGAAEWHGHLTDVIDQLQTGKMTIQEAGDSLGLNLT